MTDNRPTPDPAVASPGDTINYTAIISNSGTADATGVQFNDTVDANTTVVTASVKMSPLAFADNYNGVADTPLVVAAAQGVLANDTGLPAPTAGTITDGPTTQGGTVTLNSDGGFTYTPPANFAGASDTFTYTATNGQLPNDTATVTIAIACPTISVTNPANTAGTADAPFSETFTQTGGNGAVTFATASTLPAGLVLATNGVLSGTPTQTGSFPIAVTVTDANGCTGTGATYNLIIACQTITVTNPANGNGTVSAAFSETFTQTGAIGTATFTLASGVLPSGLTLATNGVLSGTPTQSGSFPITVTVTDSNGCTGTSATYTIVIACQTITVNNPANTNGTAGSPFSETFTQSNAVGGATFTTASTLPAGLTLATNGVLSGTPTQTGTFPITVTVTDANGCTGTGATYNLTIACQTITVSNPANATGTVNAPFSETFTQTGAIGTATFTLASGVLPAGLTLATNGVLSGTPTEPGTFPITVTVTDANGCTGTSATYNLVIACQTITVTNPANSSGTVNAAFSETFTQTGATGTATFTTTSTLPAGLTLATNGVLSGTPTETGSFPIDVTVTDDNGCTGTGATYTLIISSGDALMFAEGGVLAALYSPSLLSKLMLPLTASAFEAKRDGRITTHTGNSISRSLTQTELNATVATAIQRWTATGLTQKQIASVLRIKFEVADLSGKYLGEADGNRILVSRDAQGKGWFIDSSRLSDSSFAHAVSSTRFYADPTGAPAGRVDLLTAIQHEIGHKLGLNDTYAEKDRDNLMYGYLTVGERRLPSPNQARNARGVSHAGPHFLLLESNEKAGVASRKSVKSNQARSLKLQSRNSKALTANAVDCTTTSTHVCVDVGTLQAGKSVTITFAVTVNTPYGGGSSVSNQGTVSGSNFSDVATDDPDTGAANDATVTPICGANLVVTNTNDSGNGSLRQTILNLCAGGTITFDPALTSGGPATITLLSELVIDKTVTISGPTNNGLTISGNNVSRIFNINSGVSLSIATLTIANGRATTGGGILNAGTLTINDSTISNNRTTDGADATGATNGGDGGNGGGIYNTGTLTLINSTVGGNRTGRGGDNLSGTTGNGGNSGSGAGIYSTGTVQLTNTTITDNQTGRIGFVASTEPAPPGLPGTVGTGGGIFQSGGTLTLNNTIVADNQDGFGTEDDINGAVNPSSSFNFIGANTGLTGISHGSNGNQIGTFNDPLSPLLGPLADNGGPTRTYLPQAGSPVIDAGSNALAKDQSNNDLTNDQRGTGFPRIINGTVEIGAVESTEAPQPAGTDMTVSKSADVDQVLADRDITYTITVRNVGSETATTVSLTDVLPQVTTSGPSTQMTFVSLTAPAGWSCSTPSVGSGGTITCTRTSVAGSSVHIFTLVGHVPSSAEPNPDDAFITNAATVSADNDPNNENDTGSASTLLVSCITNPVVTTSGDSGAGSLRQAIADACAGSTITFDMAPGRVTSPITLTSGELLVNKDLTIVGPGADTLAVLRSTAVGTPNFHIIRTTSGTTVNISGLTLTNGLGTAGAVTNGGGILNEGTLTVRNSVLAGNTAENGGGIYNLGTLTVISSTISNNHADTGSGAGILSSGTLTAINSSIIGNTGFRTGGIEVGNGTANITNSTISGNSAFGDGGGLQVLGGAATVTNATITNNRSDSDNNGSGDGGGVRRGGGTVTLRNTIVAGNYKGPGTSTPDDFGLTTVDAIGSSFNLIGTGGSGGLGNTNGNQVGVVNPLLGLLASNGGPTDTHLLLPGSPAINAGSNALLPADTFDLDGDSNTAETLPVDQRGTGFPRVINTTVDIGAVEVNYAVTATAGTPQSATVNTPFATALKVNVTESGIAQSGVSVIFRAPVSGASGTFPGPSTTAVVTTNSSGDATAPTFTANGTGGTYNVIATIGSGLPTATFVLTNVPQAATSTTVSSSVNPSNVGQSVTFTATVTSGAGTPTGTVQFKDGGVNLGPPQTLSGGVATFTTSSLTAGVHAITAEYSGDANFLPSTGTLPGGQQVGSIIRFSSATYDTTEGSGSTIITVQRIGDLSQAVSVDYTTPDDSSAITILPCSTANGVASPRCDFNTAIGTLRFAAGDGASKTFTVLINQDRFVEGPETLPLTLSNLTGGAGFSTPGATTSTATLSIADDVTEPATNPIDDTETFVRQHYRDFLNREADAAGLAFWSDNINKCNDPARRPAHLTVAQCIETFRVHTSAAFYLSIEFQQSGYFIYRMFKTGYDDIAPPTVPVPIRFADFIRDTGEVNRGVIVGQGNWEAQLNQNKQAYALLFVQRPEFLTRYPSLTNATAFVDMLNENAGNVLSPSERSALIGELSPSPADPALRASVVRKVAENALLQQQEFNRAFVLMQYFGYLRRNPDAAPDSNFDGYNFWLDKLNSFNGDFVKAEMVKAFIESIEYRSRFGS